MQNRYAGDVGDFGKYGLLRALSGPPLRLGIVWYLYPDEPHTSDGKFTDYPQLKECDPRLYDALMRLVGTGNRSIAAVRESGILPGDTLYHEPSLSYPPHESSAAREERRDSWMDSALKVVKDADIVFVDPDNGISLTANPLGRTGPKYVFMDDLRRFYGQDQSLVIYHHLGRHGTAGQQIEHLSDRLQQDLSLLRPPWAIRYRRGTSRVYFIVAQQRHETILERRLKDFRANPRWFRRQPGFSHPHFEEAAPTTPYLPGLEPKT